MPNFAGRAHYQWAPHPSSPRRAAWEGTVLMLVGLLCALIALKAIVL